MAGLSVRLFVAAVMQFAAVCLPSHHGQVLGSSAWADSGSGGDSDGDSDSDSDGDNDHGGARESGSDSSGHGRGRGRGRGQGGDDSRSDSFKQAVANGDILSYARIKPGITRRYGSQIIRVEVKHERRTWLYEIKLISRSGRLIEVTVDARTGRVIKAKNDQ